MEDTIIDKCFILQAPNTEKVKHLQLFKILDVYPFCLHCRLLNTLSFSTYSPGFVDLKNNDEEFLITSDLLSRDGGEIYLCSAEDGLSDLKGEYDFIRKLWPENKNSWMVT